MHNIKTDLQAVFLDWTNNYLTVERFAADYGLSKAQAKQLITLGRSIHNQIVKDLRKEDRGRGTEVPANER